MSRSFKEHIVKIIVLPCEQGISIELTAKGCNAFLSNSLTGILEEFYNIEPVIVDRAIDRFIKRLESKVND